MIFRLNLEIDIAVRIETNGLNFDRAVEIDVLHSVAAGEQGDVDRRDETILLPIVFGDEIITLHVIIATALIMTARAEKQGAREGEGKAKKLEHTAAS